MGSAANTYAGAGTWTELTTDINMAGGDEKKMENKGETKVETKGVEKDKKVNKDGQKGFKFEEKAQTKNGLEGFMLFLWNPETKEFLGRTGMSWLKIGVFYLIYYTFLAGFFMLMLLAFFATLNPDTPTYDTESGLIGKNPGVGFRPMPPNKNIESTLIWFRHGNHNGNWEPWVERLEDHLTDYKNKDYASSIEGAWPAVECGDQGEKSPGTSSVCAINQDTLFQGQCTKENDYGFRLGKPCILIKLNKIFNWEPLPYNNTKHEDEEGMPIEDGMPPDIPNTIKTAFQKNVDDGKPELNERVWLECEGENPADKENLGKINYYPTNGVGKNFFPYKNQKGYLSPVVFAQLENPTHGVMIAIECKAWFQGVDHDSMERKGLVHFELMID